MQDLYLPQSVEIMSISVDNTSHSVCKDYKPKVCEGEWNALPPTPTRQLDNNRLMWVEAGTPQR